MVKDVSDVTEISLPWQSTNGAGAGAGAERGAAPAAVTGLSSSLMLPSLPSAGDDLARVAST